MDLKYWDWRKAKIEGLDWSKGEVKPVLAPRHGTYIDYLKEQERDLCTKLGVSIANLNMADVYDRKRLARRVDTLSLMKDIVSDAIDKEKI